LYGESLFTLIETTLILNQKLTHLDKIVFFDGECGLCNWAVDFFIRIDGSQTLYFSSLQSAFAIQFLKEKNITIHLDTIYFYHNQRIYDKSTAMKQIFLSLNKFWRVIGWLISLVPKSLADCIYCYIARNRFKLFGKTSCRIPTEEEKKRFLG
jgi:predicted DCC family thiol-disulfide oxidoreductase YuxK